MRPLPHARCTANISGKTMCCTEGDVETGRECAGIQHVRVMSVQRNMRTTDAWVVVRKRLLNVEFIEGA